MIFCFRCFVFLSLLFITLSCGYRWGRGEIGDRYASISVPYVEGDEAGILTSAIIQRFVTTGALAYSDCEGDLLLNVCLLKPEDQKIGFIYAPEVEGDGGENALGSISNIVVSNEARLILSAKVSLIDRSAGCVLLGPVTITSSLTFDFDPDLSDADDHTFALGQLEMHPLARDTAFPSLYRILAEKIVDYVNHSW